mgnify:CR=1 FL=1
MYTDTTTLVLLSLITGIPSLYFLIWGIRNGQFDHSDEAAESILEDADVVGYRPWEKPVQQQERMRRADTDRLELNQRWEPWL